MKKAFTLIELLVVIAIIAILAAILFPVFAQAKAAAKASANLSNLKQVGLAMIQYSNDSDDVLPLAVRYEDAAGQANAFGATTTFTTTPANAIPWTETVYPYSKNRDIYTSPLESSVSGTGVEKAWKQAQFYGVMPTATAINAVRGSTNTYYPLAGSLGNGAYVDGPFGVGILNGTSASSMSQSSVDHLSDVVLVSDAGAYDMGLLGSTAPSVSNGALCFPAYAIGSATQWSGSVYAGPWGRKNASGAFNGGKVCKYETSQRGQVTYAAVDGSAKSVDLSRVYEKRTGSVNGTNQPVVYRLFTGATQ